MGILVISFDSVGDKVFESMADDKELYPNIAKFMQNCYYRGGVKTSFISNTYPVHTTISTGVPPRDHGIISNYLPPNKKGEKHWAQMAHYIKVKTMWQAAKEKRLKTAAFLWPVTCGAKIDYHMPEVHLKKGQSRYLRQLMYGSKFFQLKSVIKHGREFKGEVQPNLDNFVTSAVCSLLKKKKPDLVAVHLLAYDLLCHSAGSDSISVMVAKKVLDKNLGRLLELWNDTVIIFSDHSQLDVEEVINLNALYGNIFIQNGGCAFSNKSTLDLQDQYWFGRYLTKQEMEESGYAGKVAFGIAAKPGFTFCNTLKMGDHGYPTDYDNSNVFYAINKNLHYEDKLQDYITDITAIIAMELGLDMEIVRELGIT